MLRFLTLNGVIRLHEQAIERHGGRHGVRDHGLLNSSLAQPKMALHYEVTHAVAKAKAAASPFCSGSPVERYSSGEVGLSLGGGCIVAVSKC